MQLEVVDILEKVEATCVMVTHDQSEAMTMASRIAIMNEGEILQVGTPSEIYELPNCRYTAEFIGTVNLFDGTVIQDEADHVIIQSPVLKHPIFVDHGITGTEGMSVTVALRPEKISMASKPPEKLHNCAQASSRTLPISAVIRFTMWSWKQESWYMSICLILSVGPPMQHGRTRFSWSGILTVAWC